MPAIEAPYATVDDYEARYGPVDDRAALSETLMDATRLIASECARSRAEPPADALMQACRSMASRAVQAAASGAPQGVTQFSQSAIGISESWTMSNPNAEVYMSKSERRLLGIGAARAGSVRAAIGGAYEAF